MRELQVVQRGERLRLRVVLHDDAPVAPVADRLRAALAARLAGLGVADPQIDVETVARLERARPAASCRWWSPSPPPWPWADGHARP